MSLVEFLLARIAEDREFALAPYNHWTNCPAPGGHECTCIATLGKRNRRRLAECEAKRRIVEHEQEWARTLHESSARYSVDQCTMYRMAMYWVLERLVEPYADHPDYNESG